MLNPIAWYRNRRQMHQRAELIALAEHYVKLQERYVFTNSVKGKVLLGLYTNEKQQARVSEITSEITETVNKIQGVLDLLGNDARYKSVVDYLEFVEQTYLETEKERRATEEKTGRSDSSTGPHNVIDGRYVPPSEDFGAGGRS